jgi:methanogenic corrinoid protein MtbC1
MLKNAVLERYLDTLLKGDRKACRSVIEESLQTGTPANAVYLDIIWPIMAEIEHLARNDVITSTQEHLATRINRTIVDQLQNKLPRKPTKNKRIVISCAPAELQELGAQIMADLFESDGWEVKFLGSGLTNDDILEYIHESAPDILLIYGSTPKQAPDIRQLIDMIRDINAWPNMHIMVSGGLFNRAEGLWQEIGADLFAENAMEALQLASMDKPIQTEERMLNRRKKNNRSAVKRVQVKVLE